MAWIDKILSMGRASRELAPVGAPNVAAVLAMAHRERAIRYRMQRDANWSAGVSGMGSGGFSGGQVDRLTASLSGWSAAVNADLDGQLVIMRARARQLSANNEFGRRFLTMCAANIVGRKGPQLQVRAMMDQRNPDKPTTLDKSANDAIEIHYERWGRGADISGKMTLARLMQVAIKAVARDGETLVRVVRNRALPYGIALQLLEADRLAEHLNLRLSNGNLIRQGVETSSAGRPVAYHIRQAHPGENYNMLPPIIERVPADQIFHIFLPERAEQVRGYTWFHAVLRRLGILNGYQEAGLVAARIGASKVMALERAEDATGALETLADAETSTGQLQMTVEAGEIFELPAGYKLSSWNPEYPHASYGAFVNDCMRGIASGLDVAAHNLDGNMADVNFSSARIAELAEREQWMLLQDWWISSFVQPLYEQWLSIALLRGDIRFESSGKALPAEKFDKFKNAVRFQGRRWDWIDPLKDSKANAEEIAAGLNSRHRIAAERGEDFDDILDELKQEQAALKAADLLPPKPPSSVADPADDLPGGVVE